MSLSPYTRGRYEEKACETNAEKVIARKEGHISKRALEVYGEGDGVCSEKGRQRCCDDTEQAQDAYDNVALP